ncbi:MAG: DUF819 family protein [Bernardetiaceae bacterium]|jgi:uncharacterized membrane protein|nr:DUF819 family protein [Bernardetiaceae bacterium]
MPFTFQPVPLAAILCLLVALADWLGRRRAFRQVSPAILVIGLGALAANGGLIPASATPTPVYDAAFTYLAPLAVFLLMLNINLPTLQRIGLPMLGLFFLGTLGSLVGAVLAFWAVGGGQAAPWLAKVAGMYTGTYIGGSLNFNAIALHYRLGEELPHVFAAATAVDNVVGSLAIMATLGVTRWLARRWPRHQAAPDSGLTGNDPLPHPTAHPPGSLLDLGLLLGLGLAVWWVANQAAAWLPAVPPILVLTTLSLAVAQIPAVARLRGAQLLGTFLIYIFLAVIGAYCDFAVLIQNHTLALQLMAFVGILISTHALFIFGVGGWLGQDWAKIAVASMANIGGPPTALAVAEGLRRPDLLLPGVLGGGIGYAIGTYLGIGLAEWLQ